MFSSRPEDIAKFREVTHSKKPGVSPYVTFKCPRCKDIYKIQDRRRRGSHVRDGFVCFHCKDELVAKANMNKAVLAED